MDNMILPFGFDTDMRFIFRMYVGLARRKGSLIALRLMAPMDMIPSKHWQRVIGVMDRSG